MNREPNYLIRMRKERTELSEKIIKGYHFLFGVGREELDKTQAALLEKQLEAMAIYESLLLARINYEAGRNGNA